MKKKNLIIILVVVFVLMLIPIPLKLKDGGSIEYKSLLYNITKIHRINHQSSTGYEDGWKIEILGIQIYNKVNLYLEANNENLEYTYFYDQGYYFDFNIIEKINNKNDISNILKKINRLPDNIINKLESYNDDYFKEKNLIFIYFPMGSGTPITSLEKINSKNEIEVIINIKDCEVCTFDMSGHLYIIEIEKSDKNLITYIKTNNEQSQILKSSSEFNKTYKVKKIVKKNNDSKCQYVTLSSLEQNDEYEIQFCDSDYITFKENKMYKFTFTTYGTPSIENSIKNMMLGKFIKIKIEETKEIVNEEIIVFQNEEYELIFDKNSIVNCIGLVYEFEDGTRVYTDYTNIKYKTNNIEMPIIEALEKELLSFDDIKNYKEFKIVAVDEISPLECIKNKNYTYKFVGDSEHFSFLVGKVYYNDNEKELLISDFKVKEQMDTDTLYSVNLYFNEKLLYGNPNITNGIPKEYFENIKIGEHGYLGDKDQNGNIIGESDSFLETTKDTFKESIKLEITYCLKNKCSTETLDLKYIEEE